MNHIPIILLFLGAALTSSGAGPLPYAPAPNDMYWLEQWYLENIDANGVRQGIDMNARSAWGMSRGEGITIAIVDNGVDLSHPDLIPNNVPALNWNFQAEGNFGDHPVNSMNHGTPVAGLAAARGNNHRGVAGMAPEAGFASWVIFNTNGTFVSGEQLAKMFQFQLDAVDIQNHSWLKTGSEFVAMTEAERAAIERAVTEGRDGRGVVIVRGSGNSRLTGRNANEDAYTADPRAVTVSAVRFDGQPAGYATPGAPILVAGIGGSDGQPRMFTTDRVGTKGRNPVTFPDFPDLGDYLPGVYGFSGTSAAAPMISGTVALMLSENPEMSYRDVQQALIHAAYHPHRTAPDLHTNGAGYTVSHHTGFGLVNAGTAVDLARNWVARPEAAEVSASSGGLPQIIPDGGLRVQVRTSGGEDLPEIFALPSFGAHPEGTEFWPVVFVGNAEAPVLLDLTGKIALVRKQAADYVTVLSNLRSTGAEAAIVFRNEGGDSVELMENTYFISLPAVGVSQNAGESLLADLLEHPGLEVSLQTDALEYQIEIAESILCEQVEVTANFTHPFRGDMRLTLISPQGTRSVLHHFSEVSRPFSGTWTFMSTHHFYEAGQGTWRVIFADEAIGQAGTAGEVRLTVRGVRMEDQDRDGLDDGWENARLGSLSSAQVDDPDQDGYSNMREQILGTHPMRNENVLELGLARWSDSIVRFNWPSRSGVDYEILAAPDLNSPFNVVTNLPGGFPRTGWFAEADSGDRFFQVREKLED